MVNHPLAKSRDTPLVRLVPQIVRTKEGEALESSGSVVRHLAYRGVDEAPPFILVAKIGIPLFSNISADICHDAFARYQRSRTVLDVHNVTLMDKARKTLPAIIFSNVCGHKVVAACAIL